MRFQASHLILLILLNLFIPLRKTNNMYKKLYLFNVCALLFILALVLMIEKSCLVFFIFCLDKLFINQCNKHCIHFRVLILNIIFKYLITEFLMTSRNSCLKKPTIKFKPSLRSSRLTLKPI